MRVTQRRSYQIAALPVAIGLGVSLLFPPAAVAQSTTSAKPTSTSTSKSRSSNSSSSGSLGSSSLNGLTDYLDTNAVERTPIRVDERPQINGLPDGVSVERVKWITDRRIELQIKSKVMPKDVVKVQMLLARDWHSQPNRKFPEVWALDGLRATDIESGWTSETNIEQLFADKNVNVILPVGGESSFYSDWQSEDNGKHYMWESFLLNELIPVLKNGYRAHGDRAIFGLSMGGTAAMNLAERNPDLFKFVGSFSGYLDTTSPGMPDAIRTAQQDAGGYHSEAMWGPDGSQQWIDHDPKLGIKALKGMKVYVSAGSGRDDFGQPGSVAKHPANAAGIGLEVISRMTTQTFVDFARRDGVEVTSVFRPSGVHDWPYWQFEMGQAWPHIAGALNLSQSDRGADCTPVGAIAEATKGGVIGNCVNNEYDVAGGKGQDFTNGRAFWSPNTGAQALYGRIGTVYTELGGPGSWLGFPTSTERGLANGGRFVTFEHGNIYWTLQTDAIAVPTDIVNKWGDLKWENGDLGYPVAEATEHNGGLVQKFQNGYVTRNPKGANNWVRGAIAAKYGELQTAKSKLGYPTSDEKSINGGAFQEFENGNIYWSPATGAHVIYYGDIYKAWGEKGYEQGEYGYPTSDQESASGSITFQGGKMSQSNGKVREERN